MSVRHQRQDFRWPRLLRRLEASAYLGVSPGTFDKLVKASTIPPPKRFTAVDVAAWDILELDHVVDELRTDTCDKTWND